MPRYFFNRTDGTVDRDLDGTELPDIATARREAVKYAGETLRFAPHLAWSGEEFVVEVEDETGNVLFRVRVVAEDVHRE